MKNLILILCLSPLLIQAYKRYDGYKVLRVVPNTGDAVEAIATRLPNFVKVDFWKAPSSVGKAIVMMISPKELDFVQNFLADLDVTVKTHVENVQTQIDEEQASLNGQNRAAFSLTQYNKLADIYTWLDSLAQQYPSIASTFSVGKSFEGRDMKAIKIGAPGTNKKGFWIDAGIHAREWVAPATALYIINELVTKYSSNSNYKALVDGIDFYILPSANPDGYNYSWTTDRMWRKTRGGPYCKQSWLGKQCCYGADPNRNWDFHWMESGSSSNPCDETYAGPKAFSEVECQQMSQWLYSNRANLQAYISLHSFSELWMYEYGYARKTYPPDVNDLKALAGQAVAALKGVNGVSYGYGQSADILYPASGASDDWSKGVAGIKWTYTIELRPSDSDPAGFQLPAQYILPTATEAWAGIQVVANKVLTG